MLAMTGVTRSPFDLRSWQGLTAVLKAAREGGLAPDAYAEFRNLVLDYAQKGGDAEVKKKIDAIIATFGAPRTEKTADATDTTVQKGTSTKSAGHVVGRRIVPTFTVSKQEAPAIPRAPEAVTPPTPVSIGKEDVVEAPVVEEKKIAVTSTDTSPAPVSPPEAPKTIEEHRARIMEVKRRINALVGNPVTLMDKGNGIGRTYMSALLGAMKATSPGSTLNADEAMQELERAFEEIVAFANMPHSEAVAPDEPESKEIVPDMQPVAELEPSVPQPESNPEPTEDESLTADVSEPEALNDSASSQDDSTTHWSKDDEETTLRAVREAVSDIKENRVPIPAVERGRRSFLPSLVDIEEDPKPQNPAQEAVWQAHTSQDVVSTASVMHRPESTVTGITLGTPQAELMSQGVTAALTQLLHEWNIFASSGLFGMGPGGIDHPIYKQLSHLTMGEVLSGRWDNANPKIAHAIKDYVDAWRHEQGIAYNPTETFEHYLRRVSQRIMKRQNGEV